MHHCDNPSCFEPAHLASVSHLQNMRDMKIKGRGPTGERIAQSKLTKGDVVAIRAAYSAGGVSQGSLAAAFGVSPSEVSLIVRHRRWAA